MQLAFNVVGSLQTPAEVALQVTRINEGQVPAASQGGVVRDTVAPAVSSVVLNCDPGRGIGSIDPSGAGVETLALTFVEPVDFAADSLLVQAVTFPDGRESVVKTLTPLNVSGSGTSTMTLTFASGSVVDTWVKVTMESARIADLARNAFDGAVPFPGFRNADGDAVLYVGSLRGDFTGGPNDMPDGIVTEADIDAFLIRLAEGDLDADFRGEGFGDTSPDGLVMPADIDAFISVYNTAVAEGRHLDPLPNPGPQSEGRAEPLAIEGAPTSVVMDGTSAQPPEPGALLGVDAAEPALSDYPTPLAQATDVLVLASHAFSGAPTALASNEAKPDEAREVAVPQISAAALGSSMVPVVGLIETDAVPLVFGAGEEVAPSSSEPALAPEAEILDLLALSALAL
ncbi:MAG: hypothetical protein NTU94_16275 [Planctomycetota bacterium]|nr:hypothetical protein [Planctomycetota bacterium]